MSECEASALVMHSLHPMVSKLDSDQLVTAITTSAAASIFMPGNYQEHSAIVIQPKAAVAVAHMGTTRLTRTA